MRQQHQSSSLFPYTTLFRSFGGRDLSSLAEESSEDRNDKVIDFAERKKKKIGRNDPCPCGSGKKYKKRSEEHTSELQSRGHLVCRLLLEKKKIMKPINKKDP